MPDRSRTGSLTRTYPTPHMSIYDTAREMALNNGHEYHHAALLWRRGKLIRIGINGWESSKFRRHFQAVPPIVYESHAETDALLRARRGDTLEVLRWLKNGDLAMSRPCENCQSKIRQSNLSSVRYTNMDGVWECL